MWGREDFINRKDLRSDNNRGRRKMDEKNTMPEGKGAGQEIETDVPVPLGIACLLSYFMPVIGGVFFLFTEKRNKLIRFHAVQSVLFWAFFGACSVLALIIGSSLLTKTVAIVFFLYWIYAMYEAVQGRLRKLPVIGDIAYGRIYED